VRRSNLGPVERESSLRSASEVLTQLNEASSTQFCWVSNFDQSSFEMYVKQSGECNLGQAARKQRERAHLSATVELKASRFRSRK
jgi:hypothetical protein